MPLPRRQVERYPGSWDIPSWEKGDMLSRSQGESSNGSDGTTDETHSNTQAGGA
jgi:hypothetical protein